MRLHERKLAPALVAAALVLSLTVPHVACDDDAPRQPQPAPPSAGEVLVAEDGTRFTAQVVATGLDIPWSLAFAPDGRLFITERPGRVRVFTGGRLLDEPALVIEDIGAEGEAGLLGMALHPDFANNGLVYLAYTARRGDGSLVNRLVRFREVGNSLGEAAVLLDDIPASGIHNGSRLRFGPDRMLYMTMGDANDAASAQDLGSLNGAILRLDPDGRTPGDNPFASPIHAYGLRNPQGLDWHPLTGALWASDHGPTGNDELNVIIAGRNYGWPLVQGTETRAGFEAPQRVFNPAIAPSGLSFYTGTAIAGFRHDLFVATLRGNHLRRFRFDPSDPSRIAADERLLDGRFGRLRDVVTGPDGALYVSTSNGQGASTPAGDRIIRLAPAPARARSLEP